MNEVNIKNQTIFSADNLDVLRGINSTSIDLIYLDPPFNSNRNHSAFISLIYGKEMAEFKDIWSNIDIETSWFEMIKEEHHALYNLLCAVDIIHGKSMVSYLIYMTPRLMEMKRILKNTGSIYLHCDSSALHYLKIIMDYIFGKNNFRNEIIWCYNGGGIPKKDFPRKHDTILRYTISDDYVFNVERKAYKENTQQVGKHSTYSGGGDIDIKRGTPMTSWWTDIKTITGWSPEKVGYPTQKPLALLQRIIKTSSNEGDIILDPFCGCATTCVAAAMLSRRWIGIDISEKAAELLVRRLANQDATYVKVIHRMDIPKRSDI